METSTGKCNYCLGKTRTQDDFEKTVNKINPHIKIIGNYRKAIEPIEVECKIDGYIWSTTPNSILNGQGCPKCGIKLQAEKKRKTQEQFEKEVEEKFNNKIEIISKYTGIKDIVKCRCKVDGYEWETTGNTLLNNSIIGCPICRGKINGDRCRKSNEQFLKELSFINPNIEPLETYIDGHSKIKCKCKIHNYIWYTAPNKILHKTTGCPKCASYKNENKIDEILNKWGYKFTIQKRFFDCKDKYTLPFDRYLDDFNVLIEYDGEQHYRPIKYGNMTQVQAEESLRITQFHDEIKNNYCKENNIPLIRIPYWEKDNIESFLFDELVKLKVIELVS